MAGDGDEGFWQVGKILRHRYRAADARTTDGIREAVKKVEEERGTFRPQTSAQENPQAPYPCDEMSDPEWLRFVDDVLDTLDAETNYEEIMAFLKTKENYKFAYIQWLFGGDRAARRLILTALEPMAR